MKILIVTADARLQAELEAMCSVTGIAFYSTESGEEAVELVDLYHYDVVVLGEDVDDMTPGRVVTRMRENRCAFPVLVLSTDVSPITKVEFFEKGADDYVVRPCDGNELIARLKVLVRRSKGLAANTVTIGPVSMDIDRQVATVNGKQIHLTGQERRLLVALMEVPGTTLSKTRLMNILYGESLDEPEIKIIDVFTCKLRKKLKDAGVPNFIKTAWGTGYRIDPVTEESIAA